VQTLLMSVVAVFMVPRLLVIFAAVALVVLAATASVRGWVHGTLAVLLLVVSAGVSVWVLQLGWALAVFGLVAAICGVVWRLARPSIPHAPGKPSFAHRSGGLIWPGVALLAAPFANILVLMPVLRQLIH